MFKFLTIGVLVYILVRLFRTTKEIDQPTNSPKDSEEDFVDYEEID